MKTLDLKEAAQLLRCNPETLRIKAKSGEIPGAKPGRCWVFVEEHLEQYLRSQYTGPAGQAEQVAKEEVCHYSVKERFGTSVSHDRMDAEYNAALALQTE